MPESVYDNNFKDLHNKYLAMMTWLLRTLYIFLQKYFQACTLVATKPKNLRGIMAQNLIDPRTFKEDETLLQRLMDTIRSCVTGDIMGMLV